MKEMRNTQELKDGLLDLINHIKSKIQIENCVLIELGAYQGESTEMFAQNNFNNLFVFYNIFC
jgi:hypothetical protein